MISGSGGSGGGDISCSLVLGVLTPPDMLTRPGLTRPLP